MWHIYPVDDLKEHEVEGDRCWCNPTEDGSTLVHKSMDGREDYETGKRKLN